MSYMPKSSVLKQYNTSNISLRVQWI